MHKIPGYDLRGCQSYKKDCKYEIPQLISPHSSILTTMTTEMPVPKTRSWDRNLRSSNKLHVPVATPPIKKTTKSRCEKAIKKAAKKPKANKKPETAEKPEVTEIWVFEVDGKKGMVLDPTLAQECRRYRFTTVRHFEAEWYPESLPERKARYGAFDEEFKASRNSKFGRWRWNISGKLTNHSRRESSCEEGLIGNA